MATFDAAMTPVGDPVSLIRSEDAPAGTGKWGMSKFDAALDAEGRITVALVADTVEEPGQSDTREDVFVASFNLDGAMISAPVQATETARGIQRDPVLVAQDDGTLFLQFMQFERPEISGPTQLIGVQIAPGAPEPEPEPEPEPQPGPGPDFGLAVAVQLTLPGGRDPAGVVVTFTADDGETVLSVSASADGAYRFDVAPDIAGRLTATKAWDPSTDPGISAADALEALRMAVGLAPSFGAATAQHFIAADIDGDGAVTATDALEILRAAVGLDSANAPRWLFVDPAVDLSGVSMGQISFEAGIAVTGLGDLDDLSMTGILLGSLVHQT